MRITNTEIIDQFEEHIRQVGGEPSDWCVGTARDASGPVFQRHPENDDGLIYREAYTPLAAEAVATHLIDDRGLEPAPEADRRAAPRAGEPGRVVFVYRAARSVKN